MTLYLKDLLANPSLLERAPVKDCCECHEAAGTHDTPKGLACEDCYYLLLGEELEQHPIGSAGIRRA